MLATLFVLANVPTASAKPLKVFILAGQSNMQGHAKIETFDYLADDPVTAPLLAKMRSADGKPRVCDHAWISYFTHQGDGNGEATGKLTAGFGARRSAEVDDGKIGPEFTFGITVDEAFDEPVLIIKTAWGGKSLNTDFRPPSAGPYVFSETQLADFRKRGKNLDEIEAAKAEETGRYYRLMLQHVKTVLADVKRVCPKFDPRQGCEIAGFVWLQGWNDLVDSGTYPNRTKPGGYDSYSRVLAQLIRDVRKDLNAPRMPFVIGVLGVGGVNANQQTIEFRKAMSAPASLPEFQGNVIAVPTAPFWSEELGAIADKRDKVRQMSYFLDSKHKDHANADGSMTPEQKRDYLKNFEAQLITPGEIALWERGASNAGYHYLGCAKTFALMGRAFAEANLAMLNQPQWNPVAAEVKHGESAGYLFGPVEKVPEEFNGGFSLYAAAWPLVATYPGHKFQTGLCGTWMHPQYEAGGKPEGKCYTDIEGGLGWWRDTHFPTTSPKFIMGGVGDNFRLIANGPGYGAGTWDNPRGKYGVAQLSPWLLFPPDGLNLKQGTSGELFGYGYLPLPLTNPKSTTAGKNVPTGNHSWTLFLNTGNFKGPVAFFTPYFWSQAAVDHPEWAGLLLDTRPAEPNKAFQMETQHIPAVLGTSGDGRSFARIAPTSFPVGPDGSSTVLHRITAYKKAALWDDVQSWFDGGPAASGAIKPEASAVHKFRVGGGSNWSIYPPQTPRDQRVPLKWTSFATSFTPDPITFGYRWNEQMTRRNGSLVTLPEYYRLDTDAAKPQWQVVSSKEVPEELGLPQYRFETPREKPQEPRTTPVDASSCWKKPGPQAGPYKARLEDGSVVTYYWYRFADQPAMLNADLTSEERELVQARVEKLHRTWTKDRDYLVPPDVGRLAELDPALILTPPPGLEVGYVPIATRQELESR
ncbi:MAG: hypothetical protein JNL96_16805 [Planctomycetaceae bacterium]|nr:hypothetical protein [Planctomycetaceae bacterium]